MLDIDNICSPQIYSVVKSLVFFQMSKVAELKSILSCNHLKTVLRAFLKLKDGLLKSLLKCL